MSIAMSALSRPRLGSTRAPLPRSVPRVAAPLRPVSIRMPPPVVHANPVVQEFEALTEDEILEKVFGLKRELFEMRVQKANGETVEAHRFRNHRKQVAQLLTVKRKKEIERGISKRESRKIEKNLLLEAGAWVR